MPCYVLSHHSGGGLVEHGDESKHGAGAANDGQGLPGESRVKHAAHSRRRDHLFTSSSLLSSAMAIVKEEGGERVGGIERITSS